MQFLKIILKELIINYKTFYKFLNTLKQIFKDILKNFKYIFAKIIRINNEVFIEDYRNLNNKFRL